MATSALEYEPKAKYRKEWRENFRRFKQRGYVAGQGATLAGLSLERGDTLFDDATFEIIESHFEYAKDGSRIAVVVAMLFDTE